MTFLGRDAQGILRDYTTDEIDSVVISDSDPGAVGSSTVWIQSGPSVDPYVVIWLRNSTNTDWLLVTTGATKNAAGSIDMWDPGFQSNLFLSAAGDTTRPTRLLDGSSGIRIRQGSPGLVFITTQGHISSNTNAPGLASVLVDPSSAGFAAPVGSLAMRQNDGVGELWLKVGSNNTDWAKVTTA